MPNKKDGLTLPATTQAHDQVAFVGYWTEYFEVSFRKSGFAKARSHRFGRGGHVSFGCVGGIDLDQLFQNVARELLRRSESWRSLLVGTAGGDEHRSERRNSSWRGEACACA